MLSGGGNGPEGHGRVVPDEEEGRAKDVDSATTLARIKKESERSARTKQQSEPKLLISGGHGPEGHGPLLPHEAEQPAAEAAGATHLAPP